MKQIIKFTLSSMLAAGIDIAAFTLLRKTVFVSAAGSITYATIIARILSGLFNYAVNKKAVFGDKEKAGGSFFKYSAQFIVKMFLSSLIVTLLSRFGEGYVTLIKMAADTMLFFFGFVIQKLFVFKKAKE